MRLHSGEFKFSRSAPAPRRCGSSVRSTAPPIQRTVRGQRITLSQCDHRGKILERCVMGEGGSVFECLHPQATWKTCKPRQKSGGLVADKVCETCSHHSDVENIGSVRNLVYWICPCKGDIWRDNVRQLKQRIDLFNGKKIIGIARKGPPIHVPKMRPVHIELDPVEDVMKEFEGVDCEFMVFDNDPLLGEVVGWAPMFDKVMPGGDDDVTLYAHAKGVRREGHPTCHRWTRIMYESLLDYWPHVRELLKRYPLAGSFKKEGHCFQKGDAVRSKWHYSGTFLWIRNRDLADRRWRSSIPRLWAGTEAVWGILYDSEEAATVFHGAPGFEMELYEPPYFDSVVEPAWEIWKSDMEAKNGNAEPVH